MQSQGNYEYKFENNYSTQHIQSQEIMNIDSKSIHELSLSHSLSCTRQYGSGTNTSGVRFEYALFLEKVWKICS